MTVSEIVKQYLIDNNYDGLYDEGTCSCLIDDLMPCGIPGADCEPGYRHDCVPEDCETCSTMCEEKNKPNIYRVGPKKEIDDDKR